jgi:hypothetical protein
MEGEADGGQAASRIQHLQFIADMMQLQFGIKSIQHRQQIVDMMRLSA